MPNTSLATIESVRAAVPVIRQHFSPAPLIRSYALEKALGLSAERRVWLKDYGWTPVGSFKLMGALNWMHTHAAEIGERPVVAHSSGNFASGISFAGMKYHKRVIVVMPDTAPQAKVKLTKSFGASIRNYDSARDHETGERERLAKQISEQERAVPAHPYNDPAVISGNGVGGLEIVEALQREQRTLSHMLCAVSGGGLMAGHALAVEDAFPTAKIIGVEPQNANDCQLSLQSGERQRIEHPQSICDGLLSYDVGECNWPILQRTLDSVVTPSDLSTQRAMRWMYETHGLRCEPSGAITLAAALSGQIEFAGQGDIVLIISGRNVDEAFFSSCLQAARD
ncbi:MAG: pyridoxal-phosphate dependent enzyme [Planctomycetales bacterium]|nr:pyridoxal-phosphate dependent enzyme [Planctomycetales bacterium]